MPEEVTLAVHIVNAEGERAAGGECAADGEAEPRAASVLARRALAVAEGPQAELVISNLLDAFGGVARVERAVEDEPADVVVM